MIIKTETKKATLSEKLFDACIKFKSLIAFDSNKISIVQRKFTLTMYLFRSCLFPKTNMRWQNLFCQSLLKQHSLT